MGTPLAINVPSVRVKRATAIFRIKSPMTGSFKTMRVECEFALVRFRTKPSMPITMPDKPPPRSRTQKCCRQNCSAR